MTVRTGWLLAACLFPVWAGAQPPYRPEFTPEAWEYRESNSSQAGTGQAGPDSLDNTQLHPVGGFTTPRSQPEFATPTPQSRPTPHSEQMPVTRRPGVKVWEAEKAENSGYVGILGGVVRPAVYRLADRDVTLEGLLRQAGGPGPQASGLIRLVRQGRTGQQLLLNNANDFRLHPGDVVILEEAQGAQRNNIREITENAAFPTRPSTQRITTESAISLALIGLISRPVIVQVPPEKCTVGDVLDWLQPGVSPAPLLRILAPTAANAPASSTHPLANGSVLVFDTSAIQPQRLPQLPPAVGEEAQSRPATESRNPAGRRSPGGVTQAVLKERNDQRSGPKVWTRDAVVPASSQPAPLSSEALNSDFTPSQEAFDPGQRASRPRVRAVDSPQFMPAPGLAPRQPGEHAVPVDTNSRSSLPRTAPRVQREELSAPQLFGPQITPANPATDPTAEMQMDENPLAPRLQTAAPIQFLQRQGQLPAFPTHQLVAHEDVVELPADEPESATASSESRWNLAIPLTSLTLFAAILAGLWGVSFWGHAPITTSVQYTSSLPSGTPPPEALDLLIDNRLPLVEEPAIPPPHLELHGQPQPMRWLRHDPPQQTVPAPYLTRRATGTARRDPAHNSTQTTQTPPTPELGPTAKSASPKSRARVSDQELALRAAFQQHRSPDSSAPQTPHVAAESPKPASRPPHFLQIHTLPVEPPRNSAELDRVEPPLESPGSAETDTLDRALLAQRKAAILKQGRMRR